MSAYLDGLYSDWLYQQIYSPGRRKSYRELFHIFFTTEFVWLVPNDDNRVEDGKSLRHEFLEDTDTRIPSEEGYWLDLGCSVLEMFLGLVKRLHFETGDSIEHWSDELLKNLGFDRYTDDCDDFDEEHIREALNDLIWRRYRPNGKGGFFPLKNPREDQRVVELWYQLNAYLLENL